MLFKARPSFLGKAGIDLVSLNFLPRSVDRSTFIPKKGQQLEAKMFGVPRLSIIAEYTVTPGRKGPRREKRPRVLADLAMNNPFLVPMHNTIRSAMS